MKGILLIVLLIGLAFIANNVNACDITFKVNSGEKEVYQLGDELVVTAKVVFTHKNCPEGIEATKFNFTGTKALGATKWKEVGNGIYERKFKLTIIDEKKDRHLFNAVRTCNKDGGVGTIKFEVK